MKSTVKRPIKHVLGLALATQILTGTAQTTAQEPIGHACSNEQPGICNASIQVLIQGNDPRQLRAALEHVGGTLTHDLPIVSGIGGVIPAKALDTLQAQPGVDRVIEDFNPAKEPVERDCPVDGDLQIIPQAQGFSWRLHNFSNTDVPLRSLSLNAAKEISNAVFQVSSSAATPPQDSSAWRSISDDRNELIALAPGSNWLHVMAQGKVTAQQSALGVELSFGGCTVELAPAYEDNHGDFYFPSHVGADLLTSAGITGAGITVAIIDSGLWNHPALTHDSRGELRVPAFYDAINDSHTDLQDLGGHGSHMASIIANSAAVTRLGATGFKGIAPDASIIPITAFAEEGDGDFLDIIRAVQWAVDNQKRHNIRILNMSLSALPRFNYWDDPINQAVLKAWRANIVVVAAAGNDGPDWGSVGSPGNNPYVITVGALTDSWTPNDRTDDYIPDFSSRGPTPAGHIKPDVVAPGGHITGLVPPTSNLATESPNYVLRTGEFVSTGSSQAAAVVSGVAALLLSAKPEMTNDQVKCLLMTSAQPAINEDGGLSYSPFTQGSGLINAARALTFGHYDCEQHALNIDAAVEGTERLYGPAEQREDGEPTLPGLDDVLSPTSLEKSTNMSRVWGVKDHIERIDPSQLSNGLTPNNREWLRLYQLESDKLNALSNSESDIDSPSKTR